MCRVRCGPTARLQARLVRIILLGLAAMAVLTLTCRWLRYYPDWLFPALWAAVNVAILGFLGLMVWYRIRLKAELRRQLQAQMANRYEPGAGVPNQRRE